MTSGLPPTAIRPILGLVNRSQIQSLRGLRGQRMSPKPPEAPTLFADLATGFAVNGWSFRKLRTAYTGACCRLVRSSDNAQSDFGFTPQGYVDIAAINLWLNGATAKIQTWYDQIGSTNWVSTFSTTSDRADLIISESRVWVNFIAAGGFQGGPSLSAWTAFLVGRPNPVGDYRTVFWNAGGNTPVLLNNSGDSFGRFESGFVQFGTQTWRSGENASIYLNFMGNPVTSVKNNDSTESGGNHTVSRVPNCLGLNPDTGGIQPFGRMDEVVFFNADLSPNLRTALNANQASFYRIGL